MFCRILIVCVGNVRRNPMAESILKFELSKTNNQNVNVSSACIHVLAGQRADPLVHDMLALERIDCSGHNFLRVHHFIKEDMSEWQKKLWNEHA